MMDKNGQLTFYDDPLLQGINEAYALIEAGDFTQAVKKIEDLMTINPDYPGLAEAYRVARFWESRKKAMEELHKGKETADFLMTQWEEFEAFAQSRGLVFATAYQKAMRYVFFCASEHYTIAFNDRENPTDNLQLLMQLGTCFIRLGEYQHTIEALEYARSAYRSNASILSLLAESYYHTGDVPRALLYFREAFLLNPSEIDTQLLSAKPIIEALELVKEHKPDCTDVREWVPVMAHIHDIFYVKRQLNSSQLEAIKKDIIKLEASFQTMNKEKIAQSNVAPRLINRYLWMLDYFEFQQYDQKSLLDIRDRLLAIDKGVFESYFLKKTFSKH
ncbi:MAG: tetratricopeptide repeat protein [Spirochaetota bacterium]